MADDTQIAIAWGSPGGAIGEISNAVEAMTGKRPRLVRLGDLAGPNETVQILLTSEGWSLIAKAVAAIYGAEIVKEVAKAHWKVAAPRLAQIADAAENHFVQLVAGISGALRRDAPVVLGLPRTPVHGRRHIAVELAPDDQPEDIARIIALLGEHGAEIERRLDEWDRLRAHDSIGYEENSDCSVRLLVLDEGAVQLRAQVGNAQSGTREIVICELYRPSASSKEP